MLRVALLSTRAAPFSIFFFFNDTATTEIYTLSLHDALPISAVARKPTGIATSVPNASAIADSLKRAEQANIPDRKSTRLNSSHGYISYAVFCLKKKKHQLRHDYRAANPRHREPRACRYLRTR